MTQGVTLALCWQQQQRRNYPKGALRSSGGEFQTQNPNIYNINVPNLEFFFFLLNWVNKLFSEENKVPRTQFEAWRVAGSATYKQSKTDIFQKYTVRLHCGGENNVCRCSRLIQIHRLTWSHVLPSRLTLTETSDLTFSSRWRTENTSDSSAFVVISRLRPRSRES